MSQVSTHTHDATPPRTLAYGVVDNTDWLKTGAIVCVSLGHFGFFFVENDLWWSIFGHFAAVFHFRQGLLGLEWHWADEPKSRACAALQRARLAVCRLVVSRRL